MENDISLYQAMKKSNQPQPFFQALDALLQQEVGHILFTLLAVDSDEVVRIYSSDVDHYPVSGRKPMTDTPWGRHVIGEQKSFLAKDMDDLKWAFFDHELIASLGGGTQINVPVVFNGECIGTINLTHRAGEYNESHLARAEAFAPWIIPYFLQAARHF
ncbi:MULTISPECIES: GAF domain-containing protein [Agrobacterium]|uniref:GAF domain-containing protein n=1 Tax=Agrobacterium rosae TaxID=1972867 RepID=A0A1R3U7G8_9HYPH|nr:MULTISPECIES: GAF domain-containing protein [Agrobacterium]KAA3507869.1 GAF domain-containing protein [Agrobacterium rosae]KAA3512848.1 GAF domain-containing protein [Agrobacterium rosae]MBN7808659.1 GAF domain-containing protein [Agrobacterium rosae]MCM2436186.1 GAF domain-containing protein [Agrobacterium rosae]MDX8305282.1 GAF domain-containing protein [Agrobacterium rosae]